MSPKYRSSVCRADKKGVELDLLVSYRTLARCSRVLRSKHLKLVVVGSSSACDICIMHQPSWVHRHLQACNFVFEPGWRRQRRHWCVHQLFAGRFQDDGAYRKWRVNLRFGAGPGAGGDVTRARAASTNQVFFGETQRPVHYCRWVVSEETCWMMSSKKADRSVLLSKTSWALSGE